MKRAFAEARAAGVWPVAPFRTRAAGDVEVWRVSGEREREVDRSRPSSRAGERARSGLDTRTAGPADALAAGTLGMLGGEREGEARGEPCCGDASRRGEVERESPRPTGKSVCSPGGRLCLRLGSGVRRPRDWRSGREGGDDPRASLGEGGRGEEKGENVASRDKGLFALGRRRRSPASEKATYRRAPRPNASRSPCALTSMPPHAL